MKYFTKRIFSMMLAMLLVFGFNVPVFAAELNTNVNNRNETTYSTRATNVHKLNSYYSSGGNCSFQMNTTQTCSSIIVKGKAYTSGLKNVVVHVTYNENVVVADNMTIALNSQEQELNLMFPYNLGLPAVSSSSGNYYKVWVTSDDNIAYEIEVYFCY